MEHAFGRGEPFRIGIEDELFLLDGDGRLAPVAESVLPRLDLPEGLAGFELFAAELELRSPPSAHRRRGRRGAAARPRGGRRGRRDADGRRPAPRRRRAATRAHVDLPRYARVGGELRGLLRRTPECALHVHVGMPDPETAIRVCNGLRTHLPLLAGLAANSPFWFGVDSGMASARCALVRSYPGRGVPRAYRDFADYEHSLETTLRAAGMEDRTQLWWDVRPHAALGTIEVREMDAQTELRDVAPARRARALPGPLRGRALDAARHPPRRAVVVDASAPRATASTPRSSTRTAACARCARSRARCSRGS